MDVRLANALFTTTDIRPEFINVVQKVFSASAETLKSAAQVNAYESRI